MAGATLAVAVFLPWYRTNLAEPFTPDSVTGWEASGMARVAFGLGLLTALASIALGLEAARRIHLEAHVAAVLGWAVVVASSAAAALVAVRLVLPPEPADFFSRRLGLYLAAVAAVAGIVAGAAHLGGRASSALTGTPVPRRRPRR